MDSFHFEQSHPVTLVDQEFQHQHNCDGVKLRSTFRVGIVGHGFCVNKKGVICSTCLGPNLVPCQSGAGGTVGRSGVNKDLVVISTDFVCHDDWNVVHVVELNIVSIQDTVVLKQENTSA